MKIQAEEILGGQYNALEIDLWLAHVLRRDRQWVFMNSDAEISEELHREFVHGVELLKTGKPLAQMTEVKEFYGLEFKVDEHVLIPRPETELIVDMAKEFIQKNTSLIRPRVLDVGTGSGCIILALASVIPDMVGVGVDMSEEALVVAQGNAVRLGLDGRVDLKRGDLLAGIDESFDVLLANLPYIGTKRFNYVDKNVSDFEPDMALFAGDDGLDLYRKMFKQLSEFSWRPRIMIGEFGFGQEEEMCKLLEQSFASHYEIIDDLAGIPRVFVVNFN